MFETRPYLLPTHLLIFQPLVFCHEYNITICGNEYFENLCNRQKGQLKPVLGKRSSCNVKNIERLQNGAKSFENTQNSAFLVKLQALNLQLCRRINSTTFIFQLICLPFKNNCFEKRVRILKCIVYYVFVGVLLFIFIWYV